MENAIYTFLVDDSCSKTKRRTNIKLASSGKVLKVVMAKWLNFFYSTSPDFFSLFLEYLTAKISKDISNFRRS